MDFAQKDLMKDDVLWFSKFIVIDLLKYRYMTPILVGALILHGGIYLIELFNMCNHPEYFLKYGPWMMSKPFPFLGVIVILYMKKSVENIWCDLERWDINSAGPAVATTIKKKIRNHWVFLFMVLLLGLVFSVLSLIPNPSDSDFFLNMHLFEMKYPQYGVIYIFVLKLLYAPMLYSMLFGALGLSYGVEHGEFQAYLLMEQIKHLCTDFDSMSDVELLGNVDYQKIMFERIRFCHKRHVELLGFILKTSREIIQGQFFVTLAISVFLLGMFVVTIIYNIATGVYENSTLNISCLGSFITLFAIVFCHSMYAGQSLENQIAKGIYSMLSVFASIQNK